MCIKIYDITVRDKEIIYIDNAGVGGTRFLFESREFADTPEEMFKRLQDAGRRLYDGTMMFADSANCPAKKVYENCKRKHGTVRSRNRSKERRERFATEFARRMSA